MQFVCMHLQLATAVFIPVHGGRDGLAGISVRRETSADKRGKIACNYVRRALSRQFMTTHD